MKTRTIVTYLVFAFLLAWAMQGSLALLKIDISSTLGVIILAMSMWTPTAAVLITKKLNGGTRVMEPAFKPKFKSNIRWYLCAWLLPIVVTVLGGALYYCIFPDQFDPGMGLQRTALESAQSGIVVTNGVLQAAIFSQILRGVTVNSIFTMLFALGEEIGWRGFLFPAVRNRTTEVKAHILCGIIWGLWHTPAIAMGHNYGTRYPGFPWLGILAMCVFGISFGIFLSYVTDKSGSIWPAALGHGTNNAVTGLSAIFLRTDFPLDNTFYFAVIFCIPYLLFGIALITVTVRKVKIS